MSDDFARCECGTVYYSATDRWTDPDTGKSWILPEAVTACPRCMSRKMEEQLAKAAPPLETPSVRITRLATSEEGIALREEFRREEEKRVESERLSRLKG